jgi:drug/metabolite transporter (DMT)-like permease
VMVTLLAGGIGVAVIVWPSLAAPHPSGAFLFGATCLIANAFAFALYSNLTKRWLHGISPLVVTGGTMLSGALGLMLLALVTSTPAQWHAVVQLSARQWGALLFLILGCSVLAYFIYNLALQHLDASRAALYIYSEPVVAVALGVALLGESLTAWTILGALIIAGSIVVVNLRSRV